MLNKELQEYLEKNISKENNKNDEGHNMDHINYVLRRSLTFAKEVENININMVYTIAYYHDIAHHQDHEHHELLSAEYLKQDKKLLKWFTNEEITIMAEAIEDHRASNKNEPRSIYGKIISSADRNTNIIDPLKRTYAYRSRHNPELSFSEILKESQQHLQKKFGQNGYAINKMYFNDIEYEQYLKDLNKIIYDDKLFKKKYLKVNKINEKEYELNRARLLCQEVNKLANKFNLEYFFITEGASSCHIKNNDAIRTARQNHEKWEKEHGFNPQEDWSKENEK